MAEDVGKSDKGRHLFQSRFNVDLNRLTPAIADKPGEIGKQSLLWYKYFQLHTLANMGLG